MSRSLNKVMLIGNLGADPEVRSTNNGTRVATLSLATSRQWTTQGGEKQEKTEWHRCVVWNTRQTGLADVVEKYLKKGDRVYVEGRIEYRTWKDREGQTRYTTEVNVRDLVMLSGRGDGGGAGESGSADRAEKGRRAAAPTAEKGAGAGAGSSEAPAKADSFEDFPEALDEEDDDLPF
ncbi:MAG: single-stranded DNA-binding protein [Gemmatimonadales bacterium]